MDANGIAALHDLLCSIYEFDQISNVLIHSLRTIVSLLITFLITKLASPLKFLNLLPAIHNHGALPFLGIHILPPPSPQNPSPCLVLHPPPRIRPLSRPSRAFKSTQKPPPLPRGNRESRAYYCASKTKDSSCSRQHRGETWKVQASIGIMFDEVDLP